MGATAMGIKEICVRVCVYVCTRRYLQTPNCHCGLSESELFREVAREGRRSEVDIE